MYGSPLIENVADRTNRLFDAEQVRMLLGSAAVGVCAGLLLPHLRLHLGLSGHRALLWMVPVIVARMRLGAPGGATVGALAAACASLATGGQIAGGPGHLALIGVAGVVLDAVIGFAERRALAAPWLIVLLGSAGALANTVCFVKRLASPMSLKPHALWWAAGEWGNLMSYALFGLFAGLIGGILGSRLRRCNDVTH